MHDDLDASQAVVLFKIDGSEWTLDLRQDSTPSVAEGGPPADVKPDLTLTISDDNFAKLVAGKLGPQQVGTHRPCRTNCYCSAMCWPHIDLKLQQPSVGVTGLCMQRL